MAFAVAAICWHCTSGSALIDWHVAQSCVAVDPSHLKLFMYQPHAQICTLRLTVAPTAAHAPVIHMAQLAQQLKYVHDSTA